MLSDSIVQTVVPKSLIDLKIYNVRAIDLDQQTKNIIKQIFQILINQRTLFDRLFQKNYVNDTHSNSGEWSTLFGRIYDTGDIQIQAASHMEATILACLLEFIVEYVCKNPRTTRETDKILFLQYIRDYLIQIEVEFNHILNFDRLFEDTDVNSQAVMEFLNVRMTFKTIGATTSDFIKDKKFMPYSSPPEYPKLLQDLRLLLAEKDNIVTFESLLRYFDLNLNGKIII